MTNKDGEPLLKKWRFVTSSQRQAGALSSLRCQHPPDFKHGVIQGSTTKGTEVYPLKLCRTILSSLFGLYNFCPSLPVTCSPCSPACLEGPSPCIHRQHREKEVIPSDFEISDFLTQDLMPGAAELDSDGTARVPLAVHKLLDRGEMRSSPDAMNAVRSEKQGLLKEGTWLEEKPVERDVLVADAKAAGRHIHLGELMPIASIKHWESPALRKYKGRIVFRGDCVKDQDGKMAVFQEIAASPSAIFTINSNQAYGLLPGHKSTTADAEQAYLQAELKSQYPTWVLIPKELWPKHWHGKYYKPMCRLYKSLYGHPESGGHWENHLKERILKIGGEPVQNHPSTFWFPESRLLLSVYVDDLLLSGPSDKHESFWAELRKLIRLGDPEPLDRFLGRNHRPF